LGYPFGNQRRPLEGKAHLQQHRLYPAPIQKKEEALRDENK